MRSKLRTGTLLLAGTLLVLALLLVGAYRASQHVPEFYVDAIALEPPAQKTASRELAARATALFNDVRRPGDWHALFTAEQINGWLATDLEKHGDLLAEGVAAPRVGIEPDRITFAMRLDEGRISAICSLSIEAYVSEPNVLALRIRKVRAGALPLPLKFVLEKFTETARQMELPLQWTHAGGDPVALVTIVPRRNEHDHAMWLESIKLEKGEIYLSGRTMSDEELAATDTDPGEPSAPGEPPDAAHGTAQPGSSKYQR